MMIYVIWMAYGIEYMVYGMKYLEYGRVVYCTSLLSGRCYFFKGSWAPIMLP